MEEYQFKSKSKSNTNHKHLKSSKLKKLIVALVILFVSISGFAQKGGRPYYGGGHHTSSHVGSYPGSVNSYHKGGHYKNSSSNNRYGIHSFRRRKG